MANINEIFDFLNDLDINLDNFYYRYLLNKIKNIKEKDSLKNCILQANSLLTENLQKIYSTKNSNNTDSIKKLSESHNLDNIIKLFSVFQCEDKKLLNTIITNQEGKITYKNLILVTKLCLLGLCFKVSSNGSERYYVPSEVQEAWNNNTNEFEIIDDVKKIIKMCGVIKLQELYVVFTNIYNSDIELNDFKFYLNALCTISNLIDYDNKLYYTENINEKNLDKYLEIQEKNNCYLDDFCDKSIIDLYQENTGVCSPIGEQLLVYLKNFDDELNMGLINYITQIMREQFEFDANELMDEINDYVTIDSDTAKYEILQFLIRMYHDTRLYKLKGYKPIEVGAYLTDSEIEKIENDFEIKFKHINFLRLEDLYPDYLYKKFGIKNKKNEDGSLTYYKSLYFIPFEIRKNKKFATYLYEIEYAKLENLCEIYCKSNLLGKPPVHKEEIIDFIEANKEQILECNYVTLCNEEFMFLNNIVKNNGYLELLKDKTIDLAIVNELITKGFIFTRFKQIKADEIIQIHIPNDTLILIKNIFNKYEPKQILDLRILLSGIANAYGVVTKTQARNIVSKVKSNYLKIFDKFSTIINYRDNENYEYNMSFTNIVDGETTIFVNDFLTTEKVNELLNIDIEYKLFSYNDYIKLGEFSYKKSLCEYKKFEDYLKEHFDITCMCAVDDIIDKCYFNQQTDEPKLEMFLLRELQSIFVIDNDERINIFNLMKNMVINICNKLPQWKLKGNIEEKIVGDDLTKNIEEPKIGRNDPCFCGSGRKYKKCHGK